MAETRHTNDPISGERVEIRNDLTKRLRGIYARGPTLANGEPEFGWRKMAEPPSIQVEAAERIETLEGVLRALADAADDVGVHFFDTDDMPGFVEILQSATKAARAALT